MYGCCNANVNLSQPDASSITYGGHSSINGRNCKLPVLRLIVELYGAYMGTYTKPNNILARKPIHDFKLAVLAQVAELFDLLKQPVRASTVHYHLEHRMQLVTYAVKHLSMTVYVLTSEPNPTQLSYRYYKAHSDSNIYLLQITVNE